MSRSHQGWPCRKSALLSVKKAAYPKNARQSKPIAAKPKPFDGSAKLLNVYEDAMLKLHKKASLKNQDSGPKNTETQAVKSDPSDGLEYIRNVQPSAESSNLKLNSNGRRQSQHGTRQKHVVEDVVVDCQDSKLKSVHKLQRGKQTKEYKEPPLQRYYVAEILPDVPVWRRTMTGKTTKLVRAIETRSISIHSTINLLPCMHMQIMLLTVSLLTIRMLHDKSANSWNNYLASKICRYRFVSPVKCYPERHVRHDFLAGNHWKIFLVHQPLSKTCLNELPKLLA